MSSRYQSRQKYQFTKDFLPWFSVDPNYGYTYTQDTAQNISMGLYHETTIGQAIINRLTQKVVGSGLTPMASPEVDFLGWSKETADKFQKQAEAYYRLVTGNHDFDYYKHNNLKQLQSQALKIILNSGDVLLHRGYRNNSEGKPAPYVQLINGRSVRNPNYQQDTKKLVGGVRLEDDLEQGYYIMVTDDMRADSTEFKYVSKYNPKTQKEDYIMIQLASPEAGMVRGIPFLTAVKDSLLQCNKLTELHLSKAIIQTIFTVFIERDREPSPGEESFKDKIRLGVAEEESPEQPAEPNDADYKLGSGAIIEGNPGEKMVPIETKLNAEEFSKALEIILKLICAACGLSYEELLCEFKSSYSASRATINESEKGYKTLREELCDQLMKPIYEQVIEFGIIEGKIEAPGFWDSELNRRAVLAVSWVGVTPTQVDPTKEIKALKEALSAGVVSREYICRVLYNMDFNEIAERLVKEEKMLADLHGETSKSEENTDDASEDEDKDEQEDADSDDDKEGDEND